MAEALFETELGYRRLDGASGYMNAERAADHEMLMEWEHWGRDIENSYEQR